MDQEKNQQQTVAGGNGPVRDASVTPPVNVAPAEAAAPTSAEGSVQFSSQNIGRKEATKYFDGRVRESGGKRFGRAIWGGKRKWITIGVVGVLLVGAVVLWLWLNIWNKSSEPVDNGGSDVPAQELTWEERVTEITRTANDMMNEAVMDYEGGAGVL